MDIYVNGVAFRMPSWVDYDQNLDFFSYIEFGIVVGQNDPREVKLPCLM